MVHPAQTPGQLAIRSRRSFGGAPRDGYLAGAGKTQDPGALIMSSKGLESQRLIRRKHQAIRSCALKYHSMDYVRIARK